MRSELLLATSWKGPRPCDFGFIVNFPPGARQAWDRQLARLLALYRPVGAAPQPPPPPALVVRLDSDDDGDGDGGIDGDVEGGRAAAAPTAAVAGLNQAAGGRGGGGIGRRRWPSDPLLAPVEAVLMVDDEDDEDKEDEGEDVKKAEDGDADEVAQPAGEGAAEERNGDGSDVGDNGGNNADNGVDDGEAIEAAALVGPALSAASVDSSDEMPVYFGAGASMRTE